MGVGNLLPDAMPGGVAFGNGCSVKISGQKCSEGMKEFILDRWCELQSVQRETSHCLSNSSSFETINSTEAI